MLFLKRFNFKMSNNCRRKGREQLEYIIHHQTTILISLTLIARTQQALCAEKKAPAPAHLHL